MMDTANFNVPSSTTRTNSAPEQTAGDVHFATFSAANTAARLLLDNVQRTYPQPTLKTYQRENGQRETGYQLKLAVSSDPNDRMWSIGAAASPMASRALRRTNQSCNEPEILLVPPGDSPSLEEARQSIGNIHAFLSFHPRSAMLRLRTRSRKPIIYEKGGARCRDSIISSDGNKFVTLWQPENYLWFGPYRFVFEYAVKGEDEDTVNQRFNENLGCLYYSLSPSEVLNFFPKKQPRSRGNVSLHKRIPNSPNRAGVDIQTGLPVVVGGFRNDSKTWSSIFKRLQIAHNILHQDILNIIEVWCDHEALYSSSFGKQSRTCGCTNIYFSIPPAEYTFLNMPWDDVEADSRALYFYQSLRGLADIHHHGVTHGQISPSSLLILRETESEGSANHASLRTKAVISLCEWQRKDTKSLCIPPEFLDKPNKYIRDQKLLDRAKADIWALAVSWLYALLDLPQNASIMEGLHHRLLTALGERIESSLMALIRQMLAWEPHNRPSAADALEHEAWVPFLKMGQAIDNNGKRKLTGEMPNLVDQKRAKKETRELSPGK
ncbi:hypothetical protein V8C35DRAFT_291131 [Trichoderma chlorosporum]